MGPRDTRGITLAIDIRGTFDGFDRPIELVASLGDGEIVVDFAGTSPYSDYGINGAGDVDGRAGTRDGDPHR